MCFSYGSVDLGESPSRGHSWNVTSLAMFATGDGEYSGLKVDMRPLQAELFFSPHPGIDRHLNLIPVLGRKDEPQPLFLFLGEITGARIVCTKEFDRLGRVLLSFAPLHYRQSACSQTGQLLSLPHATAALDRLYKLPHLPIESTGTF